MKQNIKDLAKVGVALGIFFGATTFMPGFEVFVNEYMITWISIWVAVLLAIFIPSNRIKLPLIIGIPLLAIFYEIIEDKILLQKELTKLEQENSENPEKPGEETKDNIETTTKPEEEIGMTVTDSLFINNLKQENIYLKGLVKNNKKKIIMEIPFFNDQEFGVFIFEYESDKETRGSVQLLNRLSNYLHNNTPNVFKSRKKLNVVPVRFSINNTDSAEFYSNKYNAQFALWGEARSLPVKDPVNEKFTLITYVTMANVIEKRYLKPGDAKLLKLTDDVVIGFNTFEIRGELEKNFLHLCRFLYGMLLLKEKDLDNALSILETVQFPKEKLNYAVQCHLGRAYYNYALNIKEEINKQKKDGKTDTSEEFRKLLFNRDNYLQMAKEYVEKSIKNNKKYSFGSYCLGKIYTEMDRNQDALPHFKNAVANDRDNFLYIFDLYLSYLLSDNVDDALKTLDDYLSLPKDNNKEYEDVAKKLKNAFVTKYL